MKRWPWWIVFCVLAWPVCGATASPPPEGTWRLETDAVFGSRTDWKTLFGPDEPDGLAVAKDGTVFLLISRQYAVVVLNPDGTFRHRFHTLAKVPARGGIVTRQPAGIDITDDGQVVVCESGGTVRLFDQTGNPGKVMRVNYILHRVFALEPGKVALRGFVVWSGGKVKQRLSCLDLETGKDTELLAAIEDEYGKVLLTMSKPAAGQGMINKSAMSGIQIGNSFSGRMIVARRPDGTLVTGQNTLRPLMVVNREGRIAPFFEVDITPMPVQESDRAAYRERLKKVMQDNQLQSVVAPDQLARQLPGEYPYYSGFLGLPDGGVAVLVQEKEGGPRQVVLYSPAGKRLAQKHIEMAGAALADCRWRSSAATASHLYLIERREGQPPRLLRFRWPQ